MENNKLPTAKEFLKDNAPCSTEGFMIEFARMHVKAALKEASVNLTDCHFSLSGWKSNKEEILEAYPLENIK